MRQLRVSPLDGPVLPITSGPVTEEHLPVLLWMHSGTATVAAGGASYSLRAGEAIWVPPGVEHCTTTDIGGVVLPIFAAGPPRRPGLGVVRVIDVPDGWADWLVSQFDFNRHHTRDEAARDADLVHLVLRAPSARHEAPGRLAVSAPPMPSSPEAHAVATALLRSPRMNGPAEELSARQNVSVRTLQRQFHDQTGLSLSAWRTRARVAAAASLLDAGRDVGWAGREVGYLTPAGFTRAFRRHVGVPPQQYARRGRAPVAEVDVAATGTRTPLRDPPPIPPRRVWSWVYDWHVLWWAYRGEVILRVGTREIVLRRGQAVWLPAGFSASVDELADGSILLPLGNRLGGANLGLADLVVQDLGRDATPALLRTVLTEYTLFRPVDGRDGVEDVVDAMFREQFTPRGAVPGEESMTGAVAIIARSLRRNPADGRSLAAWAERLGSTGAHIGREFRLQTGRSFPRWRAELRMSLARELLMEGVSPRDVARTLGYASSAAFGQVFSTAHGITARRYQLRVTRRHVADED